VVAGAAQRLAHAVAKETIWSAAASASVGSKTASTWLGPSSISSERSGRPSPWAVARTIASGSSAMSAQPSASRL
jgi:hypothetical protein